MGRTVQKAAIALLAGGLVAGAGAVLPAHSTTTHGVDTHGVGFPQSEDHTGGSVVDLSQLEVDDLGGYGAVGTRADSDLLILAVLGVTELRDDRILHGFVVNDPTVTSDGSAVTVAVPTDPSSLTIFPATGETLEVGVHDASTTSEPAPGEVGLKVDGMDEVCTQAPTGQVAIQDVGYRDGVLETLAADFLVSCDEGLRELEGQVRLATDVDQTPWFWFEPAGGLWSMYGETQEQQGGLTGTAPGYRVTGVVDAAPFEHVEVDVGDQPCWQGAEFCWMTDVSSSWLEYSWVATITESPDLPLGRTGFRPTKLRTFDGVLNPTDILWNEQSTESIGLSINYNRLCPSCSDGSKYDLVWWRRSDAGEEWQQLDRSSPGVEQLDRFLMDKTTEPELRYEYRVTNVWHDDYVLTSDTIGAWRLLQPIATSKRAQSYGSAVPPDVTVDGFDEVVASAQESWSAGGRSESAFSAVEHTASSDQCFAGYRRDDLNVWRHAGANRYETAVCVSQAMWAGHADERADVAKAHAVVLVRGDRYEDATSAGPLAAWAEAPLLLTPPDSLESVVREEIDRVLTPGGTVYLIGGTTALSADVEAELSNAGYTTSRLAGPNRYTTAVEVAKELPTTSNFFFATGKNFPDALAAGTAAAALTVGARETAEYRPFAVLLTRDETMSPDVSAFVQQRAQALGNWTLVTAGGQAEQAVVEAFGASNAIVSFSGGNRYETAALIAKGVFTQPESGELVGLGVGLATGTNFPDALAATPYLAEFAQPLLLTRQSGPGSATAFNFLRGHAGEGGGQASVDRWLDAFGGVAVIDEALLWNASGAF